MSFVPYLSIWVLLVAAGVLSWLVRRRWVDLAMLALLPTLIIIWLIIGPEAAEAASNFSWLGWQWFGDSVAWGLTGILLLLTLISLAYSTTGQIQPGVSSPTAVNLTLSAATMPVLWAADGFTRVFFITLWLVCLAGIARLYQPLHSLVGKSIYFRILLALFLLWFAAITGSPFSVVSTLVAALLLLGIWPFDGRPDQGSPASVGIATIVPALPVLVGASVLASAIRMPGLNASHLLVATILGLFSLLTGLIHFWQEGQSKDRLQSGLGLALSGIILLAGLWAGATTLVAAAQLAIFIPVLLDWLLDQQAKSTVQPLMEAPVQFTRRLRLSSRTATLGIVYLALAGLPLTAGFISLSALYQAWIRWNGYALILVMVILWSLWLATLFLLGRKLIIHGEQFANMSAGLLVFPPILAFLGLLRPDLSQLTGLSIGVWIALVVPPIIGVLVGRFLPDTEPVTVLLKDSLSINLHLEPIKTRIGEFSRGITGAWADAMAILEGDQGLLWIAGLLLLLLWVS
jgi:hypothetical protein